MLDPPRSPRLALAGVLVLAGLVFFARLGAVGLFDADEPAYAVAAREMVETGNWVTPTFNGEPRFDKPILFYYLVVLAFATFGVNEFAVRFWPALAGVCLAVLLWRLGRRHAPAGTRTAVLAFLLCPLTWVAGRSAVTDMVMVLLLTGCLALAYAALAAQPEDTCRWAWLGAAACSALAVLVKGPIGLVLPGLILVAYVLLTGQLGRALRRPGLLPAALLFLGLVLPWYTLVIRKEGWAFVDGFILKHHLRRYTIGVSGHERPFWYYVPVLLVAFFPWSAFLPGALARVARRRWRAEGQRGGGDWGTFCGAWFIVTFLFFSLGRTKLPTYLFAAFPALAFLVAGWIEDPGTPRRAWRRAGALLAGLGLLLAAAAASVPWVLRAAAPRVPALAEAPYAGWVHAFLAAVLAGGTAAGAAAAWAAHRREATAVLAAMMILVGAMAVGWVLPVAHAYTQAPLQGLVEEVRGRLRPGRGDAVIMYGFNAPSVVFYAGRRVQKIDRGDREELRRAVIGDPSRRVFALARGRDAADLAALPGVFLLAQRGGYSVYWMDYVP